MVTPRAKKSDFSAERKPVGNSTKPIFRAHEKKYTKFLKSGVEKTREFFQKSGEKMAVSKSKVKASLLEQLTLLQADKPVFLSLVDDYMKLWATKEKLLKDIGTRGISFEDYSASGKRMMKQNPSTKEVVAVSSQMLKILEQLNISTTSLIAEDDIM